MRPRENRQADHIHILLEGSTDHHLRRSVAKPVVDHFHACVAQGHAQSLSRPGRAPSRPGFLPLIREFSARSAQLQFNHKGDEAREPNRAKTRCPAETKKGCRGSLLDCLTSFLISRLRHRYQQAMERYGDQAFAIFSMSLGLGSLRLRLVLLGWPPGTP